MGESVSKSVAPKKGTSKKDELLKSLGVVKPSSFIGKSSKKILQNYTLGKCLGKGAYGEVFIGTHKVTGQKRAIKQIKKVLLADLKEDVLYEFNLLRQLDHPNITKVYEAYEDASSIYIVSELFEGGDLYNKMSKEGFFDEKKAAIITKQILVSLAYCHEKNLTHRDLKPQNVMMEDTSLNLKLIDFGFAKYYKPAALCDEQLGTPIFMAPEIINGKKYDAKVDIWSLGIMVLMMLTGKIPYKANSLESLYKEIAQSAFDDKFFSQFKYISQPGISFMVSALKLNPLERFTAKQLLDHPWLSKEVPAIALPGEVVAEMKSNIRKMVGANRMQNAVFSYLALNANKNDQIKMIKELFVKLDTSKDGKLSKNEVLMGFRLFPGEMPFSLKDADEMFTTMDKDGSGTIEYSEFLQALISKAELTNEMNLKAAFAFFDSDGNGYITASELIPLFSNNVSKIACIDIQKIIDEADIKKDGKIEYEEFKIMMSSTCKKTTAKLVQPMKNNGDFE